MIYEFYGNQSSYQNYFSTFSSRLPNIIDQCIPTALQQKFEDVIIIFLDTNLINVCCIPSKGVIFLPAGVLDYLWHSCCFNYSAYSQYLFVNSKVKENQIDNYFTYSQMFACEARLSALIKGIAGSEYSNIPLPDPNYNVTDGSMSSIAADIMLYAVGAALLHEISHINDFREGIKSDCVGKENRADAFASLNFISEEILNKCTKVDKNKFKTKLLWSLTELCFLLFRADFLVGPGEKHPNAICRFENMIAQHSNILNLQSDLDYKKEDGFDIRSVVGYASFVLHTTFQLHLQVNNDERTLHDFWRLIANRTFESDLDLYQNIRSFISNYTNNKSNSNFAK